MSQATVASTSGHPARRVPHKAWVLATVCAAVLAINLDTTIVNVALPSISRELSAGTRQLQWVVDGYNLAFAGLVLAAGSLSDRFGRRPALLTGLIGFAGASAAGALTTSADALVATRFLMGTFAALIFPTTLSIISNTFRERRERAAALGIWGAVVGLGVATGPITGGVLLEHFYWGSVFWALVPLALVTAVAAYVWIPESRDPAVPPLDLPGLGLSAAMLATLTYTIIEAPAHGWASTWTLAGFGLAGVLLAGFVVRELRTPHPMLDVSLFRDRRFSAASGAVTVTFFALFGFIFLVTQYFQFVRGYGALSTGARILPVALSIAVASVVGAALAPRIGTKVVVTTGMVLFGAAFLWISTSSVTTSYATVIVPQMVMMGLGMGLISTPATESILLVLPPARAGVGSAVNDATRELGGTLGVAVVGSVFASVFGSHLSSGAFSSLPTRVVARAQDSVGVAQVLAGSDPRLVSAFHDSFMSAMSTACVVVGLLCLAGAVASAVLLPGRLPRSAGEQGTEAEPLAARPSPREPATCLPTVYAGPSSRRTLEPGVMVVDLVALFFVVVLALAAGLWFMSARVVRQIERGVVFRLGRAQEAVRAPGLTMLVPMVDRMTKVNIQVVTLPVPAQEGITRDNVTVRVDAVVYFRVTDPLRAAIVVQDYRFAISQVAQTSLRSIIGKSEMDDLLSNREKLNEGLEIMMDSPAAGWGIEIDRVEIKDVALPESMKRSMSRQAEAERERRSRIITADGEMQASEKLAAAARTMSATPAALQLRLLQTMVEVAAEKNSTLVLPFPVEMLRFFEAAASGGAALPRASAEQPAPPSADPELTSTSASGPTPGPLLHTNGQGSATAQEQEERRAHDR